MHAVNECCHVGLHLLAVTVDLRIGGRLSLYGLADDDVVLLRMDLPAAAGAEVPARVLDEDGATLHEADAIRDEDSGEAVLVMTAEPFERGSYSVEAAGRSYVLDVR